MLGARRAQDAVKCYLRAEANGDKEGIALLELARLYAGLKQDIKVPALLSACSLS